MTRWLSGHVRSIVLAFLLLTLAGLGAAFKLPVSLFPHIDFPRVVVSVDAGDRAADQTAVQVTRPLEEALRSVPGVAHIRSTTSHGGAEISLTFDWGHDMVAAALQTEGAINAALPNLPPGVRFTVRRMDTTIFPILGLALSWLRFPASPTSRCSAAVRPNTRWWSIRPGCRRWACPWTTSPGRCRPATA
jgi:multidrug efflux pump subunit AcrB